MAVAMMGHNNPPPDIKVGEALREELRDNHADLTKRKNDLIAMADRFDADHETIDDDETSGTLAGIITQINGCAKIADTTREGIKSPYLEGGRIVDGFFNAGIKAPLETRASQLNAKQTTYQRAKADRARREAEEATRKARAEEDARRREAEKAERERQAAERAAAKAKNDESAAAAAERARQANERAELARQAEIQAQEQRMAAAKVAASSAADRSRVRGEYAMASLRTTWKFKVVDITKVPAEYLMVNESVINALIRGKSGRREIAGLDIFPVEEAVNR